MRWVGDGDDWAGLGWAGLVCGFVGRSRVRVGELPESDERRVLVVCVNGRGRDVGRGARRSRQFIIAIEHFGVAGAKKMQESYMVRWDLEGPGALPRPAAP